MTDKNENIFFVIDDHGRVQAVSDEEAARYTAVYATPKEALEVMRQTLMKEFAYNGRDIANAQKRIDELKMKQADDAVILYRVVRQLGEISGDV